MHKLRLRIFTLLLVPCIVVDPVTSNAIAPPYLMQSNMDIQNLRERIDQEAISCSLADAIKPFIQAGKLFWAKSYGLLQPAALLKRLMRRRSPGNYFPAAPDQIALINPTGSEEQLSALTDMAEQYGDIHELATAGGQFDEFMYPGISEA